MKAKLFIVSASLVFLFGCQKSEINNSDTLTSQNTTIYQGRKCASYEVLQQQLKDDPTLASRMNAIEDFTARYEKNPSMYKLVNGVINIPVVVNVLYKTSAENIALGQIQSQIDVLNEDYNALNADYSSVPALFSTVKTNVGIKFYLDTVIRKATTKTSWSTNDACKKTSQGGLNPTSPTTKMNMWCCTLGQGLLGYAQFPGGSSATDGVVILNKAFGSRSKYPGGYYTTTYDLGRTATHEVGHWMNLRHIWGDATCGNDLVGDTPLHNGANYGCPAYPTKSTCTGTPVMMTMNYMDYTDDRCMYMFTVGQKSRMNAIFVSGGARFSFAQP